MSASFKSTQKTTATYRQTFVNQFFVLRNAGYISVVNPATIFNDHFTFSKSNVGEKVKYKYGHLNLLSFLYYYYFLRRCKPPYTLLCTYYWAQSLRVEIIIEVKKRADRSAVIRSRTLDITT